MAEVKVSALTALTGANVANGDELYIVDTGSPNVSKKITADELAQMPQLSSRYAPLAGETVWLPATQMETATVGSASKGKVGTRFITAWLMDGASTAEDIVGTVFLPTWWNTIDIDMYWSNDGAGSGDIYVQRIYLPRADGGNLASDTGLANANYTITAAAEDVLKVSSLGTGISRGSGMGQVYLARFPSNAADTLGNDIAVHGFLLKRAS